MIPLRELLAPPAEDWRLEAACRGMAPIDGAAQEHPFFPTKSEVPAALARLCDSCPVRRQCESAGEDSAGIWAGRYREGARLVVPRQSIAEERRSRVVESHRLRGFGRSTDAIAGEVGRNARVVLRFLNEQCDTAGCWCGVAQAERRSG